RLLERRGSECIMQIKLLAQSLRLLGAFCREQASGWTGDPAYSLGLLRRPIVELIGREELLADGQKTLPLVKLYLLATARGYGKGTSKDPPRHTWCYRHRIL